MWGNSQGATVLYLDLIFNIEKGTVDTQALNQFEKEAGDATGSVS
jgi:hypothetical protein